MVALIFGEMRFFVTFAIDEQSFGVYMSFSMVGARVTALSGVVITFVFCVLQPDLGEI